MAYFFDRCPDCGNAVPLPGNGEVGQWLECGDCRKELEVVWSDPITLIEYVREEEYLEE